VNREQDALTIDELARRVGMTARNVRAYQSRGLIPPPTLRGRTGYYGPQHVARLELIRELQAEGFNLESIRRLLERAQGQTIGEVLDFTRALAEPFGDEEPEVMSGQELARRFSDQLTPEIAGRTQRLGLVRPLGDDLWELRSPRLARAAQELMGLGVPLTECLDLAEILMKHADAVGRTYVKLFFEHVWRPFQRRGEPSEEWPEVREALERLRPLAVQSLLAVFQLAMGERVEHAFERELVRMSEPPTRESGRRRRGHGSRTRRTRRR
jgi:DNA-binding transcriptional MerR regulator